MGFAKACEAGTLGMTRETRLENDIAQLVRRTAGRTHLDAFHRRREDGLNYTFFVHYVNGKKAEQPFDLS